MEEYQCFVCHKTFERYPSQVKTPGTVCCSRECTAVKYKTSLRGSNNANFRHGEHSKPSICSCGREKDYRSVSCAICAKVGFSKDGEKLFSLEEISIAVKESETLSEASSRVGCSRNTVTRVVEKYDLDTSHMRVSRGRERSIETIFCMKDKRDSMTRKYLRKLEPDNYTCAGCDQVPEWNGRELSLEMDHIDGNSCNDMRSNLRWLCPNCHSQTSTFRGRNIRKELIYVSDSTVR